MKIRHQKGKYWVLEEKKQYLVMMDRWNGGAESLAAFHKNASGLSLARAYVDYLHSRKRK